MASQNDQNSIDTKTLQRVMKEMEDGMDARLFRRGVVRSDANPKCKNKGPRPGSKDQKLWAPLNYFVHSVSGTIIAMMHKLGMFRLQINYGVAMVSRYLYDHVSTTLKCFMDENDQTYSGRYYQCYRCR